MLLTINSNNILSYLEGLLLLPMVNTLRNVISTSYMD